MSWANEEGEARRTATASVIFELREATRAALFGCKAESDIDSSR